MAEETEAVEEIVEEETGFLENDPIEELFSEETAAETVKEEEVVTAPETEKVIEETVVTTDPKENEVPKDPDSGWKAAYFAEKGKRQKLEEQKPAEVKPEFDWKNPEKTMDSMKNDLRVESEDRFIKMSLSQLGGRKDDAKEKLDVFDSMAKQNPALFDNFLKAADPGQYAYEIAEKQMFHNEVGNDPAAYKAKIEAEVRAKIETEDKTKTDNHKEIANGLPPSAASMVDKVPANQAPKESFDVLFPNQIAS